MGSGCIDPARLSPTELSNLIKGDQDLTAALLADQVVLADVHKAVRAIVDQVAERTAIGALKAAS